MNTRNGSNDTIASWCRRLRRPYPRSHENATLCPLHPPMRRRGASTHRRRRLSVAAWSERGDGPTTEAKVTSRSVVEVVGGRNVGPATAALIIVGLLQGSTRE